MQYDTILIFLKNFLNFLKVKIKLLKIIKVLNIFSVEIRLPWPSLLHHSILFCETFKGFYYIYYYTSFLARYIWWFYTYTCVCVYCLCACIISSNISCQKGSVVIMCVYIYLKWTDTKQSRKCAVYDILRHE